MDPRTIARRLLRHHAAYALALALVVAGVSWKWNTRAASGSDAYGYVSQADLWLRGELQIPQPFAADVPWPLGPYTFAPLGYRPTADGRAIVPTYSPGLPLMMAAAKALGGHCALFTVVPLLAGVLVYATYAIGRQVGRPAVGLAAAWLVAASPATLFAALWPMSDVPAAATWAVAIALAISETPLTAAVAGLAACVAILVRPNLTPIAALLGAWLLWRDLTARRAGERRRRCAPWYALGASLGVVAAMVIFTELYGSPFRSGYGDLSSKFAVRHVSRNLWQYGSWLVAAETPLAVAGLLSLAVPSVAVWATPRARRALWLFCGSAAAVWASYLAYQPFSEWWYLRFLLPSWPMMALGTASVLAALYRRRVVWAGPVAVGAVALVGAHGVHVSQQRNILALAYEEAVYVEAARVVEAFAGPDDVVFSGQFSGSLRHYAGRLTFSYRHLPPEWLDRAVQWFQERGHHVYFLLTVDELWHLRTNYASTSQIARLNWPPLMLLRGGEVRLFDSAPRPLGNAPESHPVTMRASCQPPRPYPALRSTPGTR